MSVVSVLLVVPGLARLRSSSRVIKCPPAGLLNAQALIQRVPSFRFARSINSAFKSFGGSLSTLTSGSGFLAAVILSTSLSLVYVRCRATKFHPCVHLLKYYTYMH